MRVVLDTNAFGVGRFDPRDRHIRNLSGRAAEFGVEVFVPDVVLTELEAHTPQVDVAGGLRDLGFKLLPYPRVPHKRVAFMAATRMLPFKQRKAYVTGY